MLKYSAIKKPFSSLSTQVWLTILLFQATLGFVIILFPSPSTIFLSISMFILIPVLYVWPVAAFALILLTVPSYTALFEIGKLTVHLNDIAIILGIVALFMQWIRQNEIKIDLCEFDIPIVLILVWVLFSLFWTPNIAMGIFNFLKIFVAMLIYFVMVNLIKDKKTLKKAIFIWFLIAVFWAIAGVYTIYFYSIPAAVKHTVIPGSLPHLGKTVRISILFGDPNDYAFALSISIMITILFYFLTTSKKLKIFSLISIILMLIVIIGTFSRKSWIGLALSILILGLKKRKTFFMFIILSLGSIAFFMWAGSGTFITALANRIASFFLDPSISITERAAAWGVAKKLFIHHPIIGNGVGSFFILAPQSGSPLNIPHSFYWYLLSEYGLVGLLLFALFVINIIVYLIRLLKKATDHEQQIFSLVLLATIPSVLFQSAFKTIGLTEAIFWIFWAIAIIFLKITISIPNNTQKVT